MKSVAFQFLKAIKSGQNLFSNHSYCLLLIIIQCGFLICSLCRIETRPCKYSRPWKSEVINQLGSNFLEQKRRITFQP